MAHISEARKWFLKHDFECTLKQFTKLTQQKQCAVWVSSDYGERHKLVQAVGCSALLDNPEIAKYEAEELREQAHKFLRHALLHNLNKVNVDWPQDTQQVRIPLQVMHNTAEDIVQLVLQLAQ